MSASNIIRIFIDTEFSDLIDMHLLSIGLVSSTGDEFYAESAEAPLDACNDFVRAAVLPQLGRTPGAVMQIDFMCNSILKWLERVKGESANVVVSYDYFGDYVLLAEVLGDVPPWVHTDNIREKIDESAREAFWRDSKLERHHALHDARALRRAYRTSV